MLKSDTFVYPGQACAQLGNTMLISDTVALLPDYAALKSDMEVLCSAKVELKLDNSVLKSDTFDYPL